MDPSQLGSAKLGSAPRAAGALTRGPRLCWSLRLGRARLIAFALEAEQKHGMPHNAPAGDWHTVTSSHIPLREVVTRPSAKQMRPVCVLGRRGTSREIRNDCDHVTACHTLPSWSHVFPLLPHEKHTCPLLRTAQNYHVFNGIGLRVQAVSIHIVSGYSSP